MSYILMFFIGLVLGFLAGGADPESTAWENAASYLSTTLMGLALRWYGKRM